MLFRQRKKDCQGFTLTEILLVVVIIGVLVGMVIPNIAGRGEQARRAAAQADIEANLAMALDMYELDTGRYPPTETGLSALIQKPDTSAAEDWSGPYLKKRTIPKDPWRNEYVYVAPGVHNADAYDLSSLGADGVASEDDIVNWHQDALE